MKRTWRIRRQTVPKTDGQRRWDRAYQLLLQWSQSLPVDSLPSSSVTFNPTQERTDDDSSCRLCQGINLNQVQTQTIDQQLERLQAHIQAQGWQLSDDHIFRDEGRSGASLNRPGLDRLRDVIRWGEIERLRITDPDRLARNYVHQMILLEEFARFGCQAEFLDHPMSKDPHDQLLLQIRGAVAEYERSLITDRMRRGRLAKYQPGILAPLAFCSAQLAFLATAELDYVLINVPCYSVPPQSVRVSEALLYHKLDEIRSFGQRPPITLKTSGRQV